MLLPSLSKNQYHPLLCRDGVVIKSAKEQIPSIVIQEMTLLPNLSKSQYHTLWCRDNAVTKSVQEPIPSIVMQRLCYPCCQRANLNTIHCCRDIWQTANSNHCDTINCDAEMILLPNLSKSQYHPLWCKNGVVIKSAKEQIPSIVMQR